MRRSGPAISLSIALLATALPASAGPIGLTDDAAPAIAASIVTFPGPEAVAFNSVSTAKPVRCAWPLIEDQSAPDTAFPLQDFDLVPAALEDGVNALAAVVDCDSPVSEDSADEGQVPAPQLSGRLRAAVQTAAITTSLMLVLGLGWLFVVVTRRADRFALRRRF